MKVCLFSDVHANLPALETFLDRVRGGADAYVCLGDVVNYGPWNDECLEIVNALPDVVVLEGNHERLFLGTEPIERESLLVRDFFEKSAGCFTRRDLIADLPVSHRVGDFVCTHTIQGMKIYADTSIEVTADHFIGHTHHLFRIERSGRTIVNCGSVGQNRRTGGTLTYVLYDTADGSVALREEPYPVDRMIRELVARRYPQHCVDYYLDLQARGRA